MYVYKDPRNAFEFYGKDLEKRLKASLALMDKVRVGAVREHEEAISTLHFELDSINQSIQAHFNAAYLVFATDPCANQTYLQAQISEIIKREGSLREVCLLMDRIGTSNGFQGAYDRLIGELGRIGREINSWVATPIGENPRSAD